MYYINPLSYTLYGLTASQVSGEWSGPMHAPLSAHARPPLCPFSFPTLLSQLGDVDSPINPNPLDPFTKPVPVYKYIEDTYGYR